MPGKLSRGQALAGQLSRRDLLRMAAAGAVGATAAPWFGSLAARGAEDPARHRSCILLWMSGGPSQTDTFDLKTGHKNGGPFQGIDTAVPGIRVSEHLPKIARQAKELAIIRSMNTKEGDHTRATFQMHTGYLPGGPVLYPSLGCLLGKEMGLEDSELPNCVSVGMNPFISPGAFSPGFLGPQHAPLVVGNPYGVAVARPNDDAVDQALRVPNLSLAGGVTRSQADQRLAMLHDMESSFASRRPGLVTAGHRAAYERADRLMRSAAIKAFDLQDEAATLRDAYGRNPFGQGCLLARRLVERGVPFVEVSLNGLPDQQVFGWDTHQNNFDSVARLSELLDAGWATLVEDLKLRGLLDSTLIVWMGEFGRTPTINSSNGRDHFPNAWSAVLAGGGVAGGQVIGRTSDDGQEVVDRPVAVVDLLATIVMALGLDPLKQNMSNVGRPIRLADPEAKPLRECLA
ncbi:MAG: DUF1501 domain-containing protein [Pirellulales bacterium]|nr:DUF1501 domain-containing protein [Pirellulales bacterium]